MPVKLVVSDIAGTTVKDNDHSVSKAFQSAFKQFDHEVIVDKIDPVTGYEKTLAIKKILTEIPDIDKSLINDDLVRQIHRAFASEMIAHYKLAPGIEALPDVEETFAKLQEMGIKVGVNTGFSRDIAETVITRLQWIEKGPIDAFIGSDEVEAGRPYPFMIRSLMATRGVTDPKEVVKVGDTEVDIREGQNAGCLYSIGITTGIFSLNEIAKYHPDYIIDNVTELLPIIHT
jgi:phosphonatase-like hydrolase